MLGWEFFIFRQGEDGRDYARWERALARWQAGWGGDEWLDDLVSQGAATDLGGNGYPNRYTVRAGALVAMLRDGLPKHDGPPVIGDDYFLPGGWTGNAKIDIARLESLDPIELLLVEAWDQS